MSIEFQIDRTRGEPVYFQIKEQLKDYILDNRIAAHTPLPSINVLTDKSGASMRTVDLALNELIKDGLCYRRPKKGTFVADTSRGAAVGKKHLCALYIPPETMSRFTNDLFDISIYNGMTAAAQKSGIDLLLLSGDLEKNVDFYRQQRSIQFDGVIFMEGTPLKEIIRIAGKYSGLRCICTNYRFEGFENTLPNVGGVFNDDFGGAHRIAAYYLERGCRKPAAISMGISNINYKCRLNGFLAAGKEQGIIMPPGMIVEQCVEEIANMIEYGYESAQRLIEKNPGIDLVMCCNDYLALGASNFIAQSGLEDRVTVTGYDNLRFDYLPKFSTVAVDFEAIGRHAFKLATEKNHNAKFTIIPPELKIRAMHSITKNG